jgi:hypothetical protein
LLEWEVAGEDSLGVVGAVDHPLAEVVEVEGVQEVEGIM